MIFDKLVIAVALVVGSYGSTFYDIPAYYGHFSLNYFRPDLVTNGKIVLLEYHFAADANYRNDTLYFAS